MPAAKPDPSAPETRRRLLNAGGEVFAAKGFKNATVREICQRYGLPYNSGPFHQQLGMVQRTILRLALPGGKPRRKPGAYTGPLVRGKGERREAVAA